MVGVVIPVLSAYLKETNWRYDAIGLATAAAGAGTLLFQTPAGILCDRIASRRLLFAVVSVFTGVCFALIPSFSSSTFAVDALLFLSGSAQTIFVPVLAALALALVGHSGLNKTVGANQSWNHAGNIASALGAIWLVSTFGKESIFYAVLISSILAAGSVFLIRPSDLNERLATGLTGKEKSSVSWQSLVKDREILILAVAIFCFHLANAPILPVTAMYVKQLGGSDKLMTATVLTAQCVMVPVALLAGWLANRWGWKPVMSIAFWALPLRIFLYSLASSAKAIVWLQMLDGIGAGIYGVVVILIAADLTKGRGHFNALNGVFATAVAIGGVFGPLLSGELLQYVHFKLTFYAFALLALAGAILFQFLVKERSSGSALSDTSAKTEPAMS